MLHLSYQLNLVQIRLILRNVADNFAAAGCGYAIGVLNAKDAECEAF